MAKTILVVDDKPSVRRFMRLYKRESDTPIIVLTAKVEESDRVLGLELGADD